jgi:formylglycine-generating enzyme required for sulfatase activity
MKYDVFISYSRKDYVDDKENVLPDSPVKAIMEFLDEKNISYWIDKKGIYSSSQFVKLITQAIRDSKMLLFVSSKNSNASDYTAGEIIEARNKGKAIIPMRIDETPFSEDYRILINKFDHIDFLKVNAFSKLLNAITKEKERINKLEAEELRKREEENKRKQRMAKRNAVLASIREQINQIDNYHVAQLNLKKSIYEQLRSIGITEKKCPICHTQLNLDVEYCSVCGWHFYTFSHIPQLTVEVVDEEKMAQINFSTIWEKSKVASLHSNVAYEKLKSENASLNAKLEDVKGDNDMLKNECGRLYKVCDGLYTDIRKLELANKSIEDISSGVNIKKRAIRTFTANGVSFNMILVSGGTFNMGSNYESEKPIHEVTLSDYYIAETQVTQELWQAVMGTNPSGFTGNKQRPVDCVSWNDCQKFIAKLNSLTGENFCLPTEAQWEYAARGGKRSKDYLYSGSDVIEDVAWNRTNSIAETHAVKMKSPNELGIYDMSGNVSEWVQDRFGSYSSGAVSNPLGPKSGLYRVNRGGSWNDFNSRCRAASRKSDLPNSCTSTLGLRLAKDI